MLAKAVHELPRDPGLRYEPKWDGFRCVVFRDGDEIELGSRNDRPLTRYFPELVDLLKEALPDRCVVDGEIVIVTGTGLDFDTLQLRLHPAASRVRKLAEETPASSSIVVPTIAGVMGSVAGYSPRASLSPTARPGWMPPPAQSEK